MPQKLQNQKTSSYNCLNFPPDKNSIELLDTTAAAAAASAGGKPIFAERLPPNSEKIGLPVRGNFCTNGLFTTQHSLAVAGTNENHHPGLVLMWLQKTEFTGIY